MATKRLTKAEQAKEVRKARIHDFFQRADRALWSGKIAELPQPGGGWQRIPVFHASVGVRGVEYVQCDESRKVVAKWVFLTQNPHKTEWDPTTKTHKLTEGAQLMQEGHQVTHVYNLQGWVAMLVDGVVVKSK